MTLKTLKALIAPQLETPKTALNKHRFPKCHKIPECHEGPEALKHPGFNVPNCL